MPRKKKTTKKLEAKKNETKEAAQLRVKPSKEAPQLVRGMKDILPAEQPYFDFVRETFEGFAKNYGYERIDLPILEDTALFVRGTGKHTDIVEKEMFSFVDQGGDSLSLRPEFTPSVVRAYINHGMINLPQPVKLYSFGPVFRHERPQAGRLRQFNQFNYDILGDAHPVLDAEMILLAHKIFSKLGLSVSVQINSIGCFSCRDSYKTKLTDYYRSLRSKLCDNCKSRLVKNPLRLLDCKEESCMAFRGDAPQILDHLDEDCKNHFTRVLEYLGETDVACSLNPYLVRGLDYYNRTVFEIWPEESASGAKDALAAGGRYDKLVEILGGRMTPAIGFAIGLERVISRLRVLNIAPPSKTRSDLFLAQLGESARRRSFSLLNGLIDAGFTTATNFSKDSIKAQLETANRLGVKIALILGQKELLDGTIIVRDMDAGVQEILDQKKLINFLRRKLGRAGETGGAETLT